MNENKILVVIVLYKQAIKDSNAYNSLKKYLNDYAIFFYDNSPEYNEENRQYLKLEDKYTHNPSNPGLSFAYNQAAQYALNKSYKWLLLLDQDTTLPDGILDTYQKIIIEYPEVVLFAPCVRIKNTDYFISPGKKNMKRISTNGKKTIGKLSLKKYTAINSGLLINVNAFIKCGGYNEKVFLDFSDFQFIDRLSKYYNDFFTIDFTLEQELSSNEDNIKKTIQRFKILCYCARNCYMNSIIDIIEYLIVVYGRAINLFIRKKKIIFFRIIFENFILGQKP
jgi:hypothetical protein